MNLVQKWHYWRWEITEMLLRWGLEDSYKKILLKNFLLTPFKKLVLFIGLAI